MTRCRTGRPVTVCKPGQQGRSSSLSIGPTALLPQPHLACGHKHPNGLEMVNALPPNPAGKVLSTDLRTRFGHRQ